MHSDIFIRKIKFSFQILINEKNVTNNNYDNWVEIRRMTNASFTFKPKMKKEEGFFCGNPGSNLFYLIITNFTRFFISDEKYAHLVIKSKNNKNLFEFSSLMTLCSLEYELSNAQNFTDLCVQNTKTSKCCKPWSLGNYIAVLNNRTSCLGVNVGINK